jgi:hypothetical protein
VWTGSANATDAAFHGNVEFMVELEGRKDRCGVRAVLGDQANQLGMRKLVEPYEPAQPDPLELTEPERIERRLDEVRRALGGSRFAAVCQPIDAERWSLALAGTRTATALGEETLHGIAIAIRPVTLGKGAQVVPTIDGSGLTADFQVAESSVTPYFAIDLTLEGIEISFLIVAELVDPPNARAERVLGSLLSNRADLIRFLLLLLGNIDDAFGHIGLESANPGNQAKWMSAFASEALLEPLVRAYSREPERLRDVERLLSELGETSGRASIFPERWDEIWQPISSALAEGRPNDR